MTRAQLLGLLGASAAMCARTAQAQTAAPVVRIGTTLSDAFAQAFYATDGGFLSRAGIDTRVTGFGGAGAVSNAVAAGAVDLGLCDGIAIANGLIRHLPFVTIAGSGLFRASQPTGLLCVDRTSPLKAPKDLEGKRSPSLRSIH